MNTRNKRAKGRVSMAKLEALSAKQVTKQPIVAPQRLKMRGKIIVRGGADTMPSVSGYRLLNVITPAP